jgi:hypothetical protein
MVELVCSEGWHASTHTTITKCTDIQGGKQQGGIPAMDLFAVTWFCFNIARRWM